MAIDDRRRAGMLIAASGALSAMLASGRFAGAQSPEINARPTARENETPWAPEAGKQIADMSAAEAAGHPAGIFNNCLPEGMPSWMAISHNALEFLVPNGGDMHIVERIHLMGPDTLHDALEVTAAHVLRAPWKTTRIYYPERGGAIFAQFGAPK